MRADAPRRVPGQPSSLSRLVHRVVVTAAIAVTAAGCLSAPSSPTPPESLDPPSPPVFELNGRVIGTVTGEPVAGATVTIGTATLATDEAGAFHLAESRGDVREISITGDGLVTRTSRLAVYGRDVTIDVIQERSPFSLEFYRRLARNAFETESALEPLRPLRAAPRVHIRTVDEAGQPIDSSLLDLVEAELRAMAPLWSGGRYPLETVERGPGSRIGVPGWVTVRWPGQPTEDRCGRATLGTTTGYLELEYLNERCYCGNPSRFAPRTIRHELGHVYGYWHTGDNRDVMSGLQWPERFCDRRPSAREAEHAKYMYSRTEGNLDPDTDPPLGTVLREPRVVVIDD